LGGERRGRGIGLGKRRHLRLGWKVARKGVPTQSVFEKQRERRSGGVRNLNKRQEEIVVERQPINRGTSAIQHKRTIIGTCGQMGEEMRPKGGGKDILRSAAELFLAARNRFAGVARSLGQIVDDCPESLRRWRRLAGQGEKRTSVEN